MSTISSPPIQQQPAGMSYVLNVYIYLHIIVFFMYYLLAKRQKTVPKCESQDIISN